MKWVQSTRWWSYYDENNVMTWYYVRQDEARAVAFLGSPMKKQECATLEEAKALVEAMYALRSDA